MKKTIRILPALLALMTLTMASTCHSDDDHWTDPNLAQNAVIASVVNTAQQGTWRITYFFDSDHEETDNFSNYLFTFGANGQLTAANGGNSVAGTWSVTGDHEGGDDSGNHSGTDVDFTISFASPPDFEDLNEDWHIVSYTADRIELIHASGGNGGTDQLTFEKI